MKCLAFRLMMAALIAAAFMTAVPRGQSDSLGDDDVAKAIRLGTDARTIRDFTYCMVPFAENIRYDGAFSLCAQGPINGIASLAFTAKKEYRSFTLNDVTDEMRAQRWTFIALPRKPERVGTSWKVTAPATEIVLQVHGAKESEVLRAATVRLEPQSWSNSFGMSFEGQGIIAVVPTATIPAGDFDVIVLTSAKEHRFVFNSKDRSKVK